jgi:hypothetical protein
MGQPVGNARPPDPDSAEHLFTTRTLLILLIAGGIGALAGLVAGYSATAVDDLPVEIAVAAGLVAFALTTFGAIRALHRLVKP